MNFFKKKRRKVTVFFTRRPEVMAMARAILHDQGFSFATRQQDLSGEEGESGAVYEIGVVEADFECSRQALRRLAELDAILCG